MAKQSTPEKWSSNSISSVIDPEGIFLPKEGLLSGNPSEEQDTSKDYPFRGADKSATLNISPRHIKGNPQHRDHSKDGERPLKIISSEDLNHAPKETMLTEASVFREMGDDGVDTPVGIEDEYNSEYDGVSTFEDLEKPEPEFEAGSDEELPEFLKEATAATLKRIEEAAGRVDIAQFFKENPKVRPGDRGAYAKYKAWAASKNIEPAWPATFNRATDKIVTAKPLAPSEPIDPKKLPKEAQEVFKDLGEVATDYVEETFRNIADISSKIASRETLAPHHGFVYGVGGVGKSFTVVKTVEEICESTPEYARWKILKGSTTPAALYQLLWKYRDGWVLIFDDNDGVLKDVNALNYLKTAMDPDQPRIISKSSMKTLGEEVNAVASFLQSERLAEGMMNWAGGDGEDDELEEEEDDDLVDTRAPSADADMEVARKKRQKELRSERTNYWIDHVDPEIDPASDDGVEDSEESPGMPSAAKKTPPEFQFASRIIFISNLSSLPQPLADRVEPGEVKLSKTQILDRVEQVLDSLIDKEPKLLALKDGGRAIKLEVLTYLRKVVKAEESGLADADGEPFVINAPFTFRLFAKCVSYRVLYPDIWKRRVIKALRERSAGIVR